MTHDSKTDPGNPIAKQHLKSFRDFCSDIPQYKALIVVGSPNEENEFGTRSGLRVASELKNRGWTVTVVNVNGDLLKHLLKAKVDVIVPVGFGRGSGEDGTISAFAKSLGIPCAGPGPICGAACTDKFLFQAIVSGMFSSECQKVGSLTVKTPKTVTVSGSTDLRTIGSEINLLRLPILIKPAYGGSSIGIWIAHTHKEATKHALKAHEKGDYILVQEYISAREISVTLIDFPGGPFVCPIVELDKGKSLIMGYEEKFGASANSRHIIPAPLSNDVNIAIKSVALKLHNAIGFSGVTRVDALIVEEKSELVLLEVNPLAGLLESSIAVDAARAAGISFSELALAYALTAFQSGKKDNRGST